MEKIVENEVEVILSSKCDLEEFIEEKKTNFDSLIVDFSGMDVKKKYMDLLTSALKQVKRARSFEIFLSECDLMGDILKIFLNNFQEDFNFKELLSLKIDISDNCLKLGSISEILQFSSKFENLIKLEIQCNSNEDYPKNAINEETLDEEKNIFFPKLKFFKIELEATKVSSDALKLLSNILEKSPELRTVVLNLSQSEVKKRVFILKSISAIKKNKTIENFHLDLTASNLSKISIEKIFGKILKISQKLKKFKFFLNELENLDDIIITNCVEANRELIEHLKLGKDREIKFRDSKVSIEALRTLQNKKSTPKANDEKDEDFDEMMARLDAEIASMGTQLKF